MICFLLRVAGNVHWNMMYGHTTTCRGTVLVRLRLRACRFSGSLFYLLALTPHYRNTAYHAPGIGNGEGDDRKRHSIKDDGPNGKVLLDRQVIHHEDPRRELDEIDNAPDHGDDADIPAERRGLPSRIEGRRFCRIVAGGKVANDVEPDGPWKEQ